MAPGPLHKILVQPASQLGAGRGTERRPPALAAIAVQGELRHDEQLAPKVKQGMVEFSGLVRKDAQPDNFVAEIVGLCLGVIGPNAEQDNQAVPNPADALPIYRNLGVAHPLNDRSHLLVVLADSRPTDKRASLVSPRSVGYDSDMQPVLLSLGPVTIYSYGVMMALGFVAAGWVIRKELQSQGRDPDLAASLVVWAAVGGLAGARLLFIVDTWPAFVADPWTLLLTGAGFIWYGGLLGGIAGVSLCIRRYRLPWPQTMDMVAPAIALGHGIGRIGCHLAGDGDWGPPTDLPWGVVYSEAVIGWPHPPGVAVHPTPLYEWAAYSLIFVFLWWRRRGGGHRPGALFWVYLVLAGLARFGLEFVRINPELVFGLSLAQVMSIPLVACGAWMLLRPVGAEENAG